MRRMPREPSPRAREVMGFVAANVRRRRDSKGYTQEDLSERADVDKTYIARVERAQVNVTIGVLTQIADALGCKAGDLLKPAKMSPVVRGRPWPKKK